MGKAAQERTPRDLLFFSHLKKLLIPAVAFASYKEVG